MKVLASIALVAAIIVVGYTLYTLQENTSGSSNTLPETTAPSTATTEPEPALEATPSSQNPTANNRDAEKEAEQLIARAVARETREREAALAELQAQLTAETHARENAEKALLELSTQLDTLRQHQQRTEEAREALLARQQAAAQASQNQQPDPEVERMLAELKAQREQLAEFEQREAELRQEVVQTRQKQWQLEDQVIEAGGTVARPLPRVWSPNYRPMR